MTEPKYKWEVAIAGLIHDIGKFYQKSPSKSVYGVTIRHDSVEHPLMADDFINNHLNVFTSVYGLDIDCIRACAVYHHSSKNFADKGISSDNAPEKYRKYSKIVDNADCIASSERDKTGGNDRKELATLEPFFIRLSDKAMESRKYAYKLDKYENNTFRIVETPDGKHNVTDIDSFIESFEDDIDNIHALEKDELFYKLQDVIQNYTWCIPAAVREKTRDVSLYQHLITTSAIASAIYSDLVACSTEEKFTYDAIKTKDENIKIVHVKLTGADSYIMRSSRQTFDMLDEIEIRKDMLEAEYRSSVNRLVKSIELTRANKVIDSGFETYLLISEQSEKEVLKVIRDINIDLKNKFLGEIYLSYSIQSLEFDVNSNGYKTMRSIFSSSSDYMVDGLAETLKNQDGEWDVSQFILQSKEISEPDLGTSVKFKMFKQTLKEYGNKIAFICVDGDNIVETMLTGFNSNGEERGTISRISTYANVMKAFFNEYVKSTFGDDSYYININANRFIIACSIQGIIEKAIDIKQSFEEYTLGTMTLSMTIHVYNSNEKFSNIVNTSSSALRRVKEFKKKEGSQDKFLIYKGLYMSQAECESYVELSSAIANSCGNINALRRVAIYSQMYKRFITTKDVTQLMCHPLYIKNNSKDTKQLDERVIKTLDKAFNAIFKGSKGINKELFLLENIIDDILIERRIGGTR